MFEKIKEITEKIFSKDECEILNKTYPHGGVACIGDQCIECNDGKWGANKYEKAARDRLSS